MIRRRLLHIGGGGSTEHLIFNAPLLDNADELTSGFPFAVQNPEFNDFGLDCSVSGGVYMGVFPIEDITVDSKIKVLFDFRPNSVGAETIFFSLSNVSLMSCGIHSNRVFFVRCAGATNNTTTIINADTIYNDCGFIYEDRTISPIVNGEVLAGVLVTSSFPSPIHPQVWVGKQSNSSILFNGSIKNVRIFDEF